MMKSEAAARSTDEAMAEYEINGFVIFRNVLDEDILGEARAHLEWLTARYPGLRPEHLHHPLMRDDAFWVSLVTNEKLLDIAELFLGPDIACFTAHYICKPPRDGQPVLWHQDGAYWDLRPMRALTVWLAIDHSNIQNGCLRMIPGSHRLPLHPIKIRPDLPNMLGSQFDFESLNERERLEVSTTDAVPVELRPGDVSVHHPMIVHGSPSNRSPYRRAGLDIGYIDTSTQVANEGLYMDPILCRGSARPGVNRYRAWPTYVPGQSFAFRGCDGWNEIVNRVNRPEFTYPRHDDEPVYVVVQRMMERLASGTAK